MMIKRFLSYLILLVAIFFSLIFIAGQNQEYQKLKKVKTVLKQEIYYNVKTYKENLYRIEKEKIKKNNEMKAPIYGVITMNEGGK